MHSKIAHFLFIVFLISSCGGSSSTTTIADDDTVLYPVNETCISIGINTKRCSFIHDDLERYYLIYTPSSMGNDNVPVLFALHGYGSSAMIHKSYTQYEELAEQNKFIIVYPQGYKLESLLVNSSSHWNVGAGLLQAILMTLILSRQLLI